MQVQEAIYAHRAVRAYTDQLVPRETILALLDAAVQAPNSMNLQPWAFAVVQDVLTLKRWSAEAKAHFSTLSFPGITLPDEFHSMIADPEYNIFYDAGTLIIICAKPVAPNTTEDCFLAAQNLMLEAFAKGLGTCPIGFAREWLNLPDVKSEIGIPLSYDVAFPVIVGYPRGETPEVTRKPAEILFWKEQQALQ